ncbi:MAG: YkgJ family cysteine cluster protein [Negativicutes bacterium]|nr:YkgJ family cysteine cluster protein [Negativicutes bacterium]
MLTLEMSYESGEAQLVLRALSQTATVADLLRAMQLATDDADLLKPRLQTRYGVCAGCRANCCHHYDVTPDYLSVRRLADRQQLDVTAFARKWLDLSENLAFPQWKKHPCPFLKDELCTIYQERALICRLYLCTPMGDSLEKLRCAVSLMGEGALRLMLVRAEIAPKAWGYRALADDLKLRLRQGNLTRAHYEDEMEQLHLMTERNPFLWAADYSEIRLADCCTDDFWALLPVQASDAESGFDD